MAEAAAAPSEIFTIGHSNQSVDSFVGLLERHRIAVVVDARSHPRSAYAHQFDREVLRKDLAARGVRYTFLGAELGGLPQGEEYYDEEGHVLYFRLAASRFFDRGIKQLEQALRGDRVAVMCSEEDPAVCHRRLLIGRVLTTRGISVVHIRGDGSSQGEEELLQLEADRQGRSGQLALFEEPVEVPQEAAWRSIRSVLPRRARPNSSAH